MNKIQSFFEKQFASFDNLAFIHLMKIFICVASLVLVYAAIFSGFQIVDEFEHLHASWLVSSGKVPYRDFFEHHHPLLWYISAPVVKAFYNQVIIFYIMRGFSFFASALTLWYIYKITLFFGDKRCGWLAVALCLCNIITLYNFYQFRPDNFMNLCFIIGLYYWFSALKTNNLKHLIFSFLAFTFSVLFLQKISLLLFVVEVILLGLILLKKMKLKDVTIAAIPSLAVLFLFIAFLYYNDSLLMYLELNYHFNQALVYYFERGAFWYSTVITTLYPVSFGIAIFFYKKENIYFKILALIYIAEFIMRVFYFAPHPNYYTLLTMLSSIILAVFIIKKLFCYKALSFIVGLSLFLYFGHLFNRLDSSINRYNSYEHYQLAQYVHQHSEPDDMLMNGYDKNFNIYRPDVSYYWFGLDMLLPVMETEYKMVQKPDVNALVIQYRPKFIYTQNYVDLRAYRAYGETRYTQTFIPEIIQQLYQPTPFEYLAELK